MMSSNQPRTDNRRTSLLLSLLTIAVVATTFALLARGGEKEAGAEKAKTEQAQTKEEAELRTRLTPLQYHVTRENGTEPPFKNEYWDNHRAGIYVDIISGEALFSSLDKFDSGTGWPSFTKPIAADRVVEKVDHSFGVRTEIRSKSSDSHLGHVFDDGPPPTRLRYCMNSAALRFVPLEKLKEEGLAQYLHLFEAREK